MGNATENLQVLLDSYGTRLERHDQEFLENDQNSLEVANVLAELEIRPQPRRSATVNVASRTSPVQLQVAADVVVGGRDDQVILNNYLSQFRGGGTMKFAEGEYHFDDPLRVVHHGTRLIGGGTGNRNGASFGDITGTIIVGQIDVLDPAQRQLYGVEIADLTLDGSYGEGINFWAANSYLHHVHVHNAARSGIRVHGLPGYHPYNTLVENCLITYCQGDGLLWDKFAADQHADGNTIYKNKGAGIRTRAGGGQIAKGQVYDNLNNIVLEGGAQAQIQLVKIENALEYGIKLDASTVGATFAMITECGFRFNGKSAHNQFAHIGGVGFQTVKGLMVSTCRFNHADEPERGNLPSYAVDAWAKNCLEWKVTNNQFGQPYGQHFGSGTVRNLGTNCIMEAK